MDTEARDKGQQSEEIQRELSPETERLIELEVELGKLKRSLEYINPLWISVNAARLDIMTAIQIYTEELDSIKQGQLMLWKK